MTWKMKGKIIKNDLKTNRIRITAVIKPINNENDRLHMRKLKKSQPGSQTKKESA